MKNKIDDLRNHLFEVIEALKDEEKPMDIERARAISDVAQTIIESAKAETRHLAVTGGSNGTGFIPEGERQPGMPRLVGSK